MTVSVKKIIYFLTHDLWEVDTEGLGAFQAFIIKTVRLINVAIREFTEGQLTLRAMSLVYTTLLSIVPVLAISFSVLKAFGVHNDIVEPFMLKMLEPLGGKGEEITGQIIGFVENMNVGVLGSVGIALLFYTVVSVIQKIETSFNFIWRIKRPRSMARRFSDYVSVILIGPVLIFSAIGLTASIMSNSLVQTVVAIEPFGSFALFVMKKAPYFMVSAAFVFVYMFIPNTKVKFMPAFIAGVSAGILWETAGWAFASFVVSSAKYAAIYSGFAIILMFMIWLYVSWLILLVGAQIAFNLQYPHVLSTKSDIFQLSSKLRERLIMQVMYLIGYNHYYGKTPWTLNTLVEHLRLPMDPVSDVMDTLSNSRLVVETCDDPPAFLPAKDIEMIRIRDLLDAVRTADHDSSVLERNFHSIPAVDNVMTSLDSAYSDTLGSSTLRDIVVPAEKD
ncbi:YihY/virulence factor BrkB family protein [bacterium]|nr:YihY/virulence factor BrkB family protein [bacterium]